MGFGQHSGYGASPLTKRDMLASVIRIGTTCPIVTSKMIARNTIEMTLASGTVMICYHQTNIVTIHADGSTVIDTGGWNTVTTRDRINGVMAHGRRLCASTCKGVLSLGYHDGCTWNKVPCNRMLIINSDGTLESDMSENDIKLQRAAIDKFMTAWRDKGLPQDSAGDPWIIFPKNCQLETEIVADWVLSRYIFRNFFAYALKAVGLSDQGVALSLAMVDRRGGKLDARDLGRIRRYARKCMGFA